MGLNCQTWRFFRSQVVFATQLSIFGKKPEIPWRALKSVSKPSAKRQNNSLPNLHTLGIHMFYKLLATVIGMALLVLGATQLQHVPMPRLDFLCVGGL